jgi:hypothetical protein
MTGSLKVQFNRESKIDVFEILITDWNEYVPLKLIPQSPEQKPSPNLTKNAKKTAAAQQRLNKYPPSPKSCVGDWGASSAIMMLFEVCPHFSIQ